MGAPRAERLDFLVERKSGVTKHLRDFYSNIAPFLESIGQAELIALIGEIIPGGKDRSPLQATDVFCWHLRRSAENALAGVDLERWNQFERTKKYCHGNLNDEALSELAEASNKMEQSGDKTAEI